MIAAWCHSLARQEHEYVDETDDCRRRVGCSRSLL